MWCKTDFFFIVKTTFTGVIMNATPERRIVPVLPALPVRFTRARAAAGLLIHQPVFAAASPFTPASNLDVSIVIETPPPRRLF